VSKNSSKTEVLRKVYDRMLGLSKVKGEILDKDENIFSFNG
jgi:hypothetical protein